MCTVQYRLSYPCSISAQGHIWTCLGNSSFTPTERRRPMPHVFIQSFIKISDEGAYWQKHILHLMAFTLNLSSHNINTIFEDSTIIDMSELLSMAQGTGVTVAYQSNVYPSRCMVYKMFNGIWWVVHWICHSSTCVSFDWHWTLFFIMIIMFNINLTVFNINLTVFNLTCKPCLTHIHIVTDINLSQQNLYSKWILLAI